MKGLFSYRKWDAYIKKKYAKEEVKPPDHLWKDLKDQLSESKLSPFETEIREAFSKSKLSPPNEMRRTIIDQLPVKKRIYLSPIILLCIAVISLTLVLQWPKVSSIWNSAKERSTQSASSKENLKSTHFDHAEDVNQKSQTDTIQNTRKHINNSVQPNAVKERLNIQLSSKKSRSKDDKEPGKDHIEKPRDQSKTRNSMNISPLLKTIKQSDSVTSLSSFAMDTTVNKANELGNGLRVKSRAPKPIGVSFRPIIPDPKKVDHSDLIQSKLKKSEKFSIPFGIGIYSGLNRVEQSLSSSLASPNLSKREAEENGVFLAFGGLNFDAQISKSLAISTGIGLLRYGENVNYTATSEVVFDTTETYRNSGFWEYDSIMLRGTWIYIDSVYRSKTDTFKTITEKSILDSSALDGNGLNRASYLNVPLNLQFKIWGGNHLALYGRIGGSIGFLLRSQGFNLSISDNRIIPYRPKKIILNTTYGLGLQFNTSSRLQFNTELNFSPMHSNVSSVPQVQKRYYSYGLSLGLRYHFFLDQ